VATDLGYEEEQALNRHVLQKAYKNLIYKSGTVAVLPNEISPNIFKYVYISFLELAGAHLDQEEQGNLEEKVGDGVEVKEEVNKVEEKGEEKVEDVAVSPHVPKMTASREYFLCLLCETSHEHPLGLFHVELKNYCESMTTLLQKRGEREVQLQLSRWYSSCIEYISRCILYLFNDLPVLLHAILLGKSVIITGTSTKHDDMSKLLQAVSIVNLSPQDEYEPVEQGGDPLEGEVLVAERLVVACDDHAPPALNGSKGTNAFCELWSRKLREVSPSDPFHHRGLVEELKLKIMEDLNNARKIVDQAKVNNYSLYKAYTGFQGNANCDVLLNLLLKDITNDSTTTEVLEVIYEQIYKEKQVLVASR